MIIGIIIAALLVILDQVVKILISSNMVENQVISVIKGFFNIHFIYNTGAAFSFLADKETIGIIILSIFSVIGSLIFAYFYVLNVDFKEKKWLTVTNIFLFSGTFGNLIDRVFYHKVVDMFEFTFFPGIFNVADAFLTTGIIMLVIDIIFLETKIEFLPKKYRKKTEVIEEVEENDQGSN